MYDLDPGVQHTMRKGLRIKLTDLKYWLLWRKTK